MAQTLSEGEVFNYTTTGAVANGDLLVVGHRAGVALESATGSGKVIGLALEGVFNVLCAATGTMTAGNAIYYRPTGTSNGKATVCVRTAATGYLATGSNIKYARTVGTLWETKTSGARTSVKVKLVGGPMPYA
jgi:predicted RecA/RadA family phage recombinase